ncbi:MAG: hypothetical protein J6Q39_06050 [Bacteroidales bacterium]|nr:hypothetical protein [Bacteroidales bacterium]
MIGSGQDLDGRAMKDIIDGNTYDYICRINKTYGDVQDVGTRCDIFFTRWSSWVSYGCDFIDADTLHQCKIVVVLNQHVNYSQTERTMISYEVGEDHVSAGPQAVHWLLNRGCRHIDLIGFGYRDGKFMDEKIYAKNSKNYPDGMKDTNSMYNWAKERQWLKYQPQVHFI